MNPFQTNTVQPQNRFTPSMFMTPQGNVYVIDSPLEVANVPMGTGLSVAICPNESLMYLKMYQNGAPSITAVAMAFEPTHREYISVSGVKLNGR